MALERVDLDALMLSIGKCQSKQIGFGHLLNELEAFKNALIRTLCATPSQKHYVDDGFTKTIEVNNPGNEYRALLDTLLPRHIIRQIIELIRRFPVDKIFCSIMLAGSKDEDDRHGHLYAFRKFADGSLAIYFVDPENNIDREVAFLLEARIDAMFETPQIAAVLYKTDGIPEKTKNFHVFKLAQQLKAAETLLNRDGLPPFVDSKSVLYRLVVKPELAVLQSAGGATFNQLESLERGDPKTPYLAEALYEPAIRLHEVREALKANQFLWQTNPTTASSG